jgi:hypothetical protein
MPQRKSPIGCSFCGCSQHEARKLIAGPSVYICDACVAICTDVLATELGGQNVGATLKPGAQGGSGPIDYKTHILVGLRANGTMSVICYWPHVPRQAEVEQRIAATRETYASFALCTATSVLPR